MLARANPANHLFSSGAHLPAPPGLVVAIRPSLVSVSASFSPSAISTVAFAGAVNNARSRYGIAGPGGLPFTHVPFSRWYWGKYFLPSLDRRFTTLSQGVPFMSW